MRGLRAVTDFSVEFDQALMYKDMAPEIEQVYLMSDLRFVFVRATRIREVAPSATTSRTSSQSPSQPLFRRSGR